MMNHSNNEFINHFPKTVSSEIMNFAIDTVFLESRYIFTLKQGKQQFGYCTHCKNDFKTEGLKHKEKTICPSCGSKCEVKSSGRGRKYLVDRAYFVYYEKSVLDPNAIVAQGFYTYRDYRDDYRKVETELKLEAQYLFEPGQAVYYTRTWENSWRFAEQKNVLSLMDREYRHFYCFCSRESIEKAVAGTPFQYSTWESYYAGDMVRFFDLFSKYPCIEYLSKLGLTEFVRAKLYGWKTYNAINWRAKSIDKVLRLPKQDIKQVLSNAHFVEPLVLRLFQIGKSDGSNLTIEESKEMTVYPFEDLKKILKLTTVRKAHSYMLKQYEKDKKKQHYVSKYQVLTHWKDYIQDCITLEMDLNSDYVLFPSNLFNAHQNTIKQVKIKANIELDKKIGIRLKSLSKFNFTSNDLFIRPAISSQELIDEGRTLKHCVGTYADRYAKGQTDIFVIRRITQPDSPFFTVEIKSGSITQTRGKQNCNPTKEVQAFMDAFKSAKLTKKRERKVAV